MCYKTVAASILALATLSQGCGTATSSTLKSDQLIYVDDSKDACASNQAVTIQGAMGTVTIAAGEQKFVDMPSYAAESVWFCGGSRERFASSRPFNYLNVSRAGNGAILWTMYVKR